MNDGLKGYLDCESLLNEFFKELKYCHESSNCHSCCNSDMPINQELSTKELINERKKIYGEGKNKPCPYLTKNGCELKTHKPAICISYACNELKKHLKKEYEIDYNILSIENKLLEILVYNDDNTELKKEIKELINKIKIK